MAIIEQGIKTKTIASRNRRPAFPGKGILPYVLIISIPVIIAIIFSIWYFSYENFLIGDYIDADFTGINGKGDCEIKLKSPPVYDVFLKEVQLTHDAKQGQLKNGDVINIEFSYDPEAAKENYLRVKDSTASVTVEGLPEGKVLTEEEVFSAMSVKTEGISPEVTVKVSNTSEADFYKDIVYEIDGADQTDEDCVQCFESGESVEIKAIVPVDTAMELNYDISPDGIYTTSYTIPEGSSYLRDASKITSEIIEQYDTLSQEIILDSDASEYGLRIFSEANNLMPIWVNGKTTFKWENPRLISAYFTTVSEEKFGNREYHDNDVKLVYDATLMQADGVNCVAEVVVQFTDLLISPEGELDLALDSGRVTAASYRNSNIAKLVRSNDDDGYNAVKLR